MKISQTPSAIETPNKECEEDHSEASLSFPEQQKHKKSTLIQMNQITPNVTNPSSWFSEVVSSASIKDAAWDSIA